MRNARDFPYVRRIVISGALAQALFWFGALLVLRNGLLPFDLVFFWLTLPTILLALLCDALPLAAGLAAASLAINVGLLILLGNWE